MEKGLEQDGITSKWIQQEANLVTQKKKKKGENSQYYHSLSSGFISWDLERFSPLTGPWTIPTCFWTEAFM